MQFYNLLRNGKAQTCAARSGGTGTVHTVKFLEYRLEHRPRYLFPLIHEDDFHDLLLHPGIDLDLRILIAVGNCIS